MPFLRPYAGRMALGLVLVVASASFGSVIPWLLREGVDELTAGAPTARVLRVAGLMLGASVAGGALRFFMRQVLNAVSRHVEYDIRDALFARLVTLDAPFYARWRTGEIMARATNDLSAVRMAAGPAIMYLVNTVAGGAFALAFMLRIDARLTGLAVLPMVALPFITVRLGRAIHDRFEAVQEHFGEMTTRAQENLAGVRVVRAYRQEASESARFAALGAEYLTRNMALARLNGVMNPSFSLIAGLGAVVVIGVGGGLVLRGAITVGAFVAFGIYLAMLTWPLIALGWVTNLFQRGAASMARLGELLDARPDVSSPERPIALPPAARGGRRLTFRDVGFHFPQVGTGDAGLGTREGRPSPESRVPSSEPRWVLRHVSFDLPAGATLGVVGAVGSGKTALIDLVPRLYDPQEGEVLLDGVPLRDLDLAALRREIGYVPQESLLFSETIGRNIGYGLEGGREEPTSVVRVEETTSGATEPGTGDAIRWAADVAQLGETVAELPAGYETILGERGVNLSGGQKQRAALARALARRPRVVLLDDALSAVDTHTEAAILRGLRTALEGRTTVIASHRISAIRDASWILVLDDGRVVEQGRHEELLARDGRYAALLRRQQLADAIESDEEDAEDEAAAAGA
ncbi:ABC transporter ATP-binding protein [Gemmatirosa kalamazoonensis]|uniref:ABC transporter ATP-binding protein n=1 Tax=Gemmatirosa kalamazoonensis TaxID=861299 RepID=UPI0004B05E14|nr:ABC transporter ATP-binding protein [Gemmatirosa kalamazoonensis]